MDDDELLGHLIDLLRTDPRTCDLPNVPALAEAVVEQARDATLTAISMIADELEFQLENPEMPWAQGVMFAVDALRARARTPGTQG